MVARLFSARAAMSRLLAAVSALAIASTVLLIGSAGVANSAKAGSKPDLSATFRFPSDTSGVHWDPTKAASSGAFWATAMWVYEPLMRGVLNGPPQPGLALKMPIVDQSTIEIELRPNVKFQDGTPLTADAVKMTLDRNVTAMNQKAIGAFRDDLKLISSVEVTGPLTLRVRLQQPVANRFFPVLTGVEGAIIAPSALKDGTNLDTTPVGAGPFKLVTYTPGQTIKMVRNPDYWDAKNVKWGALEIPNLITSTVGDSSALINAVASGQISYATFQSTADFDALKSVGVNNSLIPSEIGLSKVTMCLNKPPFDKLEVRQALQYATDREAFNNLYSQGQGEAAWSLYPKSDTIRHVSALDNYYPHNIKKAKQLLAKAGFPNGIDLGEMAITSGGPKNAEILEQQWKAAGITMTINPSPVASSGFLEEPPRFLYGAGSVGRPGIDRLVTHFRLPGITNICDFQDPKLNSLIDAIYTTTPGSADEKRAYAKAETYILEQAYNLFVQFPPLAVAWDDNVVGVTDENALLTFSPLPPLPNFRVIYIKKGA